MIILGWGVPLFLETPICGFPSMLAYVCNSSNNHGELSGACGHCHQLRIWAKEFGATFWNLPWATLGVPDIPTHVSGGYDVDLISIAVCPVSAFLHIVCFVFFLLNNVRTCMIDLILFGISFCCSNVL